MSYKYIELKSLNDAIDETKFRRFHSVMVFYHEYFVKYALPIYRFLYFDGNRLNSYHYLPTWLFKLHNDFNKCAEAGSYSREEAVKYTSYIYHDTKLRTKYSGLLTLDPKYLEDMGQHIEITDELKLAGYDIKRCNLRQLNEVKHA